MIYVERPARGEAEAAFVLVHGRGASEHDLVGLFDLLDPERRLHGYSPRGPLSLPPDYERLRPELERRLTPLPTVR